LAPSAIKRSSSGDGRLSATRRASFASVNASSKLPSAGPSSWRRSNDCSGRSRLPSNPSCGSNVGPQAPLDRRGSPQKRERVSDGSGRSALRFRCAHGSCETSCGCSCGRTWRGARIFRKRKQPRAP
jgi:hypothetical protein